MVSDEFIQLFSNLGTVCADCTFCGRVHFARDPTFYDDKEEVEDLKKKEMENREKYVGHDTDSIAIADIDDEQFILGCDCGGPDKYEKFVLEHSRQILKFIKSRIEEKE